MEQPTSVLKSGGIPGSSVRLLKCFWNALKLLAESRIALVGLIICIVVVLVAITAPWLATYDPIEGDFLNLMAKPSAEHWLGTDQLGRDIWSRLVYGAQNAVLVAFVVVPLGMVMGVIIGGIPGYFGGWVDNLVMRFNDAALSFPGYAVCK